MASVSEDMLPTMAEKLGGEGLITKLCEGFKLLMERELGVITFASLKRNAAVLGLQGMSDKELRSMMREGDADGDGVSLCLDVQTESPADGGLSLLAGAGADEGRLILVFRGFDLGHG